MSVGMVWIYGVNDSYGKFSGFIKGTNRKDCMFKAHNKGYSLFGLPLVHNKYGKKFGGKIKNG